MGRGECVKICTFFGHRDCSECVKEALISTVENLIIQGTTRFYVGNHGNFDKYVIDVLRQLKMKYPYIFYQIVLAYMPTDRQSGRYDANETLLPEGIEVVPKRFAISYRNRWMLRKADIVVAYVKHRMGSSATYLQEACKAKKTVINIAK